jgi:acetyl-CoA acyltransferase
MREVAVIGVGMHPFGRFPDKRIEDLVGEAAIQALKDANIGWKDVQAAYCGHCFQGQVVAQRVLGELGYNGIPMVNVEGACASGGISIREAAWGVASGRWDVAMAVGLEKMTSGLIPATGTALELTMGYKVFPAIYAMLFRRYHDLYGLTVEQLAKISVINHNNGCLNPNSKYKLRLTIDDVQNARVIADPLTMYHCCPNTDGAAAVILCAKEKAHKYVTGPLVTVAASQLVSHDYESKAAVENCVTKRVSQLAYAEAGIGPEDLDLIELHDCFTMAEVWHLGNMGICKIGEEGRLIDSGDIEIGGRIPVCPSGGLLAKGHPVGATGVAQVCEVTWHLRGQAGERQVQGAKVGMTHVHGAQGDSCSVIILKR